MVPLFAISNDEKKREKQLTNPSSLFKTHSQQTHGKFFLILEHYSPHSKFPTLALGKFCMRQLIPRLKPNGNNFHPPTYSNFYIRAVSRQFQLGLALNVPQHISSRLFFPGNLSQIPLGND